MADLVLTRHYVADRHYRSAAELERAARVEQHDDHPPIPAAAMPRLRVHLVGMSTSDPRIMWHHRDNGAWGAVDDLHRAGDDVSATALAVFLRWCEARGSHADHTIWALGETP